MHTHTHTHKEEEKNKINLLRTCFYISHCFAKTYSTLYTFIPFNRTCVYNARNNRTHMDTNYVSLKSKSNNITHKTTLLTQTMEYQIILTLTHNHYQENITRIPQQMHIIDNISATKYITTLFKNPVLVCIAKHHSKRTSQLHWVLNQCKRK